MGAKRQMRNSDMCKESVQIRWGISTYLIAIISGFGELTLRPGLSQPLQEPEDMGSAAMVGLRTRPSSDTWLAVLSTPRGMCMFLTQGTIECGPSLAQSSIR